MTGKEIRSPRTLSEIVEQIRNTIQTVGTVRKEPRISADAESEKP